MYNLNLAFEVADKHLDIPKMLDAEGIVALCTVLTLSLLCPPIPSPPPPLSQISMSRPNQMSVPL